MFISTDNPLNIQATLLHQSNNTGEIYDFVPVNPTTVHYSEDPLGAAVTTSSLYQTAQSLAQRLYELLIKL